MASPAKQSKLDTEYSPMATQAKWIKFKNSVKCQIEVVEKSLVLAVGYCAMNKPDKIKSAVSKSISELANLSEDFNSKSDQLLLDIKKLQDALRKEIASNKEEKEKVVKLEIANRRLVVLFGVVLKRFYWFF
jgi:predicted transcriptional regulator